MQPRADDLSANRGSKAGGGHHQAVVLTGIDRTVRGRRSLPSGHNHAVFSRCCLETEGIEHLDDALNPIRFLVDGMRSTVQTTTWTERQEGSEGREKVIGVAQIDVHRLARVFHCTQAS